MENDLQAKAGGWPQDNQFKDSNLHKFYNKKDLSWVYLIWDNCYPYGCCKQMLRNVPLWKSTIKLVGIYKDIASAQVGNGSTILLWEDLWVGTILQHAYPKLYSFTKDRRQTLQSAAHMDNLYYAFNLPLSVQAFDLQVL